MNVKAVRYFILPIIFLVMQNVIAQDSDTLKIITITGKRILNPSQGYSYLEYDSLELKDYDHEELTSLLAKKSGLYVKRSGPNGLATISVRGLSANHTKIYWNNISISSPTLGLSDLSLIPTSFFNQINVNLGGATIMDGSGAMGGSVNLINSATNVDGNKFKIGLANNPTLGFRSKNISHYWRKKRLEIQSKFILQDATNDYRYTDFSSPNKQRKRRENGQLKRYGFNQSYFYSLNRNHELSVKAMYLNNDKNISPAIGAANNFQNQSDEIFRGLLAWKFNKKKIYHALGISYMNDFSNYTDPVSFVDSKFKIKGQFLYHHLGYKIAPGLVIGSKINVENNRVNSSGFVDEITQLRTSVLGTINYSKSKKWGAVVSFRKELEEGKRNQILPSVALYSFPTKDKKVKLKMNVGKNLRLPTLNDLYWEAGGNPNLKNENSLSADGGLEYQNDDWSWNVTYYSSYTENWIQWTPNDNSIWTPENLKEVYSRGIELQVSRKTTNVSTFGHAVDFQYRYGRTENRAGIDLDLEEVNKDLILTPRHQFSLDFSLIFDHWKVTYNQRITSRVYLDPQNIFYLPYTAPASIALSSKYELGEKQTVDLILKVDNVFGEEYQILANQPMPGTNVSIILGLNF